MKSDYDDMSTAHESYRRPRKQGNKVITVVVSLLVLIIIAVSILIVVNILGEKQPSGQTGQTSQTEQTAQTAPSAPAVSDPVMITIPTQQEREASAAAAVAPPVEPEAVTAPDLTSVSAARTVNPDLQVRYEDYVMKEGDSLTSVSEEKGITVQTLISVNKITNLDAVTAGTTIRIPDRNGLLYSVQDGDTLSGIVNKFGLKMGWMALQEVNGLKSADRILPGQELFIPDETGPSATSVAAKLSFISPIAGAVTGYGYNQPVPDTLNGTVFILDGIILLAPADSSVNAAASGTVMEVACDSDPMLANYVRISHEGGYNTYYYNLDWDSICVQVGDKVDAGTALGRITDASSPTGTARLYMKIEQKGIMLNPADFF